MNKFFKIIITMPFLYSYGSAAESVLTVKRAGRPATGDLKLKSSQVPTYETFQKKLVKGKVEVVKVKNIPVLNIGEEREVKADNLTPLNLPAAAKLNLKELKKQPSPNLIKLQTKPTVATVGNAKVFTATENISKIPEIKTLAAIAEPNTSEPRIELAKINEMEPNDYKLLQAQIFLELHKNYELALGLFAELIEDPKHHIEALYNYAMTAKGLSLASEFRFHMLKVSQEGKNKEWQKKATEALASNIEILNTSDIAIIDPLIEKLEVDVTTNDSYQLARAKYYSEKGNLSLVDDALILIPETSPRFTESLLLSALSNYRQGKIDPAIYLLEKMLDVTKSDKTLPLRSVAALTLGRLQFQKNMYKEAFQSYLLVDKSNALWLQAMIESAWTQILSEDYEGAAGNMYSLHTDFFKYAFSPESYVIRTVGYLNLCQFGDGMQVLNDLNKKYSPWKKKLEDYKNSHKDEMQFYETVKTWLKNTDLKESEGLPRSFVVELARHPSFTSLQKQINNFEDEGARFNKITLAMIKMERDIIAKETEISKQLAENQKPEVTEAKLLGYRIQHHIAKKARTSIKKLREQSFARIEKEEASLRKQAAQALHQRFKILLANLNKVLDQNEVLKYELYAGAGEHIRFQMAGGDINDKEHPELKVEKEKSLNWKFKGEVWEDEVGHYRSSLKNVCPQDGNVAGN